jgi:hypothetical protein
MNTRVDVGALACLLLLAAPPTPADACSCVEIGPPCWQFWNADAVFSGRVTRMEPFETSLEIGTGKERFSVPRPGIRVTLSVIEAFRGVVDRTIVIYSAQDEGGCGYPFRVGSSYFIYARLDQQSRRWADTCSRTSSLDKAAEDLKYAHDARAGTVPAGTISGLVRRVPVYVAPDANAKPQPVPDIRVRLFGPGPVREAVTDKSGRFEFGPLAVGLYSVIAVAPPGFQASMSNEPITIKDIRQCATMNISLTATR